MKGMNMVAVVVGLVGACVAGSSGGQSTDQAALTGSGGGIDAGTGSGGGSGCGGCTMWHASLNGGGAELSWSEAQTAFLQVTALENGVGPDRTASMQFFSQQADLSSQVCYTWTDPWWGVHTSCYYARWTYESGWGSIPPGDFTVGGNAGSARLHTTTGSNFYTQRCTSDGGCQYNIPETFDLVWNKDGRFSSAQTGTTSSSSGGFTSRRSGRFASQSAIASGTGGGFTVTGASGMIHDSQGTTVAFEVLHGGP